MPIYAEIFSQGAEVVSGQIADTNAAWLSEQLTTLGFSVQRHTAVGDHLPALTALVQEIATRSDCCICTGGLGPTTDDLTTEAVSLATGYPLALDEVAVAHMQAFFARRNRTMPAANLKQAYLPATAQRIDNLTGTAPGFLLRYQRCVFVFLPGVPREMKTMFSSLVKPQLQQLFTLAAASLVSVRTIGIGESAIQQCLAGLELPAEVGLGFRVTREDVQTKLSFPAHYPVAEKSAWVQQVAALIGDYVYAIDSSVELAQDLLTVIQQLMQQQPSLALFETWTQGLIAAKCAPQAWLKQVQIALPAAPVVTEFAALSTDSDRQAWLKHFAQTVKHTQHTELALVQLHRIANSHPETTQKPASQDIVLYNALITAENTVHISQQIVVGQYPYTQNQAALLALDLLRRYLQHKCL